MAVKRTTDIIPTEKGEAQAAGTPAKPVRAFARWDPKALMQAEKRSMAFELRMAGWMPEEIAVHLGVAEKDVEKMLQSYCQQVKEKDARHTLELRELELARIDSMFAGVYPKAMLGDTDSIGAAVKLLELRAKITGSMENQPLVQQHFIVEIAGDPDHVLTPDSARAQIVDATPDAVEASGGTETGPVEPNQP